MSSVLTGTAADTSPSSTINVGGQVRPVAKSLHLAIADPPYLGRADRWYGQGRGHGGGAGRADEHPAAAAWDEPDRHRLLVSELDRTYDGWAVALAADSLHVYLGAAPGAGVAIWLRPNAIPSGSPVRNVWEPVIYRRPASRPPHATDDVLSAGVPSSAGFVGAKPEAWTHWVLDLLGYLPGDQVTDLFPGSGAVSQALTTYQCAKPSSLPPRVRERVRRASRAAHDREAAVLAALRAGGSVREVARLARLSTSTVQAWKTRSR